MSDLDKIEEIHHRIRNQIAWREAVSLVLSLFAVLLSGLGMMIWSAHLGVQLPMQMWLDSMAPLIAWSPLMVVVLLMALIAIGIHSYLYTHKLDHR